MHTSYCSGESRCRRLASSNFSTRMNARWYRLRFRQGADIGTINPHPASPLRTGTPSWGFEPQSPGPEPGSLSKLAYEGARSASRRAIKAFPLPILLARELRVAAPPAAHAVLVLREEDAGSALRTERLVPMDLVPLDLVEVALQAGRALGGLLLLLRLRHHLPSLPPFFPSGFLSSFFSAAGFPSFFSAGGFPPGFSPFFSSLPAGFSSLAGAAGFSAGFAASFRGGGVCFGVGAFASFTSAASRPLRTRMCFLSTLSASSFDLYTFAYPCDDALPNSDWEKSTTTMSRVAWSSFASCSRRAVRPGVTSFGWWTLNRTSVRFRNRFSRFATISSSISCLHAPKDVVHLPFRPAVHPDDHGSLARLSVRDDRALGCEDDAHESEEVLLAPHFESHALPRLKGFGDHGPRVLPNDAGRVVEDDHPVPHSLQFHVPPGLLDPLRLEIDDRDLRKHSAFDEVRRRVVPDGHEGLRALHGRDDVGALHDASQGAGELRPHRLRKDEVPREELSELGGRISRWH